MTDKKRRYDSIHTMKALCAFFVVCLHTSPLPTMAGDLLKMFARIGVPFFFFVSGFFSYRGEVATAEDRQKRMRKILKHLLILAGVDLVYILIALCFQHVSCAKMLEKLTGWRFLAGNFSVAAHMWFLRCLIYLELIVFFFEKFLNKFKGLPWLLGIVWILDVVVCKYSRPLFHFQIPDLYNEFLTKFIGNGVLYFFLGWESRRKEAALVKKLEENRKALILAAAAAAILSVTEYLLVTRLGIDRMPANYIFTLFLTIMILLLSLAYRNLGRGSFACYTGMCLSMYIYYWHLLVCNFNRAVLVKRIGIPKIWAANPVTVYILSVLLALAIVKAREMWAKRGARSHGRTLHDLEDTE